jgi:hypothetical protein
VAFTGPPKTLLWAFGAPLCFLKITNKPSLTTKLQICHSPTYAKSSVTMLATAENILIYYIIIMASNKISTKILTKIQKYHNL